MAEEKSSKYVARIHVTTVLVLFYFAFGFIAYAVLVLLRWAGVVNMPQESFLVTGIFEGDLIQMSIVSILTTIIYIGVGVWLSAKYYVNNIRFSNKEEVIKISTKYYSLLVLLATVFGTLSFVSPDAPKEGYLFQIVVSIVRGAFAILLFYFFSNKFIRGSASTVALSETNNAPSKQKPPTWFTGGIIVAMIVSVIGAVQDVTGMFEKTKQEVQQKTQQRLAEMEREREQNRQTTKDEGKKTMLQYNYDLWGVNFSYPSTWKELRPDHAQNGSYVFRANFDNPDIFGRIYEFVVYNKPTNSFVIVEKGNEEIWTTGNHINYASTIKLISSDGSERVLYEMPRSTVELFGNITNIMISPKADYVDFTIKTHNPETNGWEYFDNVLLEVATGKNILEDNEEIKRIGAGGWSPDGTKLVINNGGDIISAEHAIFISQEVPIADFERIFSLTNEEYNSGSRISIRGITNSEIQFYVTTDKYRTAPYDPDEDQIKAKYLYNFSTSQLEKIVEEELSIYTNDELGFTIKYPSSMTTKPITNGVEFHDSKGRYAIEGSPIYAVSITRRVNTSGEDVLNKPIAYGGTGTLKTVNGRQAAEKTNYLGRDTIVLGEGNIYYSLYRPNLGDTNPQSELIVLYAKMVNSFELTN